MSAFSTVWLAPAGFALAGAACSGFDETGDATELISRVELVFTPADGGEPVRASFSDPDGEGGASGESEPVVLSVGTTYDLQIALVNELVNPPQDITDEVENEAEEHMVFVLADLVTDAYANLESDYGENLVGDDLPLGLRHTISATKLGEGSLRIVLRHLPELNGAAQKSADLPELLQQGLTLPGDVDVDVSFELTVE